MQSKMLGFCHSSTQRQTQVVGEAARRVLKIAATDVFVLYSRFLMLN